MKTSKRIGKRLAVAAAVCAVFATLVSVGVASDLDKSEWAAWVQAFGSVGAIFGSYLIGRWQSEREDDHAQRMALLAKREKWAAVKAVLDDLYHQCLDVADQFDNADAPLVAPFAPHYDPRKFAKSLERVESIPVFELNSDRLAGPIIDFQREARRVGGWIERARDHVAGKREDGALDDARLKAMAQGALHRLRAAYADIGEITGLV
jgi:hypothetical protein